MMKDSAILLNLTSKLTIEVTDPLMSVVSGGSLLFFNRLSVEKFPSDASLYQSHIEQLVATMHNLLEARMLSAQDRSERIRLIVTLDLIGGAFQNEGAQRCFPAQKARAFKNLVAHIFGRGNPLISRLDYCFLFLVNRSESSTDAEFYKLLSINGYSGFGTDTWIDCNCLKLNRLRDEKLLKMNRPDDHWTLTRKETAPHYTAFVSHLRTVMKNITSRMEEAGQGTEFEAMFGQRTTHITTVEQFRRFDYDGTLTSCISERIGLCSSEFNNDCTFFLLLTDNSNARTRCKCEAYIASLVQLLTTLSSDDYPKLLQTPDLNASARVFAVDVLQNDDFDENDFSYLEKLIKDCIPKLETARWKKDRKVKYKSYTAKAQDSNTDTHHTINDKLSEDRQKLFNEFERIRQVPFFFGNMIGDWTWYKKVCEAADKLYQHEAINDRPLFDLPLRITDNEMEPKEEECDYNELENQLRTIKSNAPAMKPVKDLNTYLKERQTLMESFGKATEKLKTAMVRLGYLTCAFWIGLFSTLTFTLCYAFHFFWPDNKDSLWLIAVCFGIAAILFILAAVVGQYCVKAKLKAVYYEMDCPYHQMQEHLEAYLKEVEDRAKMQDAADVRRKNMDEIESKLAAFKDHNKQVDLWVAHYEKIDQKLSVILQFLDDMPKEKVGADIKISEDDFDFEGSMPTLPEMIRNQFDDKQVLFSTKQLQIKGVTSFVKHFALAEQNN